MPAPSTWVPVPARIITVPSIVAQPRGFVQAPIALRWPNKPPAAEIDCSIDFRKVAGDDPVALLTVAVMPSRPGGVSVETSIFTGTIGSAWITGGVLGVDYQLTFTASTVAGRVLTVPAWLFISQDAPARG